MTVSAIRPTQSTVMSQKTAIYRKDFTLPNDQALLAKRYQHNTFFRQIMIEDRYFLHGKHGDHSSFLTLFEYHIAIQLDKMQPIVITSQSFSPYKSFQCPINLWIHDNDTNTISFISTVSK